jgi:histidinol-phosphate aminotransferase
MQPLVFEHLHRLPRHRQLPPVPRPGSPEAVIDLASNGNPLGPTGAVRARLRAALDEGDAGLLRFYPAGDGLDLRVALAARRGVDPEQILLGNGSTELISLATQAMLMDGGSGLAARHTFSPFGRAVQAAGGRFIQCRGEVAEADPDALLAAVQPDTRIAYLANPNNPTGVLLDRPALTRLVRGLRPDILLVVDQAYAEYEDPATYPDAADFLAERGNLLVLHTFSKIHGLAALRIGYALAGAGLAGLLERVRRPFNTNGLAQVAALAALAGDDQVAAARLRNDAARQAFLAEAGRYRCRASGQAGSFLLLETVYPARELARDLFHRGVLVSPLDGYALPNHVRVAMGTPADMAAFWRAAGPVLDHLDCGCP